MLGGAKLKFEPGADSNIGGAIPPQKGLTRTLLWDDHNFIYLQNSLLNENILLTISIHTHTIIIILIS